MTKPPARAYLCRFYEKCLATVAFDNRGSLACSDCQAREDIPVWDLEQDYSGYYILLIAIFFPDYWSELAVSHGQVSRYDNPNLDKIVDKSANTIEL